MTFDPSRVKRRRQAASAAFLASMKKPTTRRQAAAWLAPIRSAFGQMRNTGEADTVRGYAVTRLNHADEYVRTDFAINGFLSLLERLMPDLDAAPMKTVGKKLEAGMPLTVGELDACFALLKTCEDRLTRFTREELVSAANTEMIKIEVEALGLQEEQTT